MQTSDTPETMSIPVDETSDVIADGEWIESPIDDETYNLLMALTSKLEAIDVYQVYAEDGNAEMWRDLAIEERRHADRILTELKQRFAAS